MTTRDGEKPENLMLGYALENRPPSRIRGKPPPPPKRIRRPRAESGAPRKSTIKQALDNKPASAPSPAAQRMGKNLSGIHSGKRRPPLSTPTQLPERHCRQAACSRRGGLTCRAISQPHLRWQKRLPRSRIPKPSRVCSEPSCATTAL